jgi:hypothetical protein
MTAQTFRVRDTLAADPAMAPRATRVDAAPMSDPTLTRLQKSSRKGKGNMLMVAAPAALVVALLGAAGVYALTHGHTPGTVATSSVGGPPAVVAAGNAGDAKSAASQATKAADTAQSASDTASVAAIKAADDKAQASASKVAATEPAAPRHTARVVHHSTRAAAASDAGSDVSATVASPDASAPVAPRAAAPMAAPTGAPPAPVMTPSTIAPTPAPTMSQPVNPPAPTNATPTPANAPQP